MATICPNVLRNVYNDILFIANLVKVLKWTHIPRNTNTKALILANFARVQNYDVIQRGNSPPENQYALLSN